LKLAFLFVFLAQIVPFAIASAVLLALLFAFDRAWSAHAREESPRWGGMDVLATFAVWFGTSILAQFLLRGAEDPTFFVAHVLTSLATIAFMVFTVTKRYGHSLRKLGWLPSPPRNGLVLFGALLLAYLPLALVSGAWTAVLVILGQDPELQAPVEKFRQGLEDGDVVTIVLLILSAVVIAPLWEEMFFRGLFQGFLRRHLRPLTAIIASAVFFAWVHGSSVLVPILGVGLILGFIYERTRNLLDAVLFHSLFNASQLAVLIYTSVGTP